MISNGLLTIERYLEWLRLNERAAAIYRGHPDINWTLTPAAFRGSSVPSIKTAAQLRQWRSAAGRFASPMPRNNVEWLVLAQHYGIATPLLDWTTNPLTALFFACLDHSPNMNGCVFQCSRTIFVDFNEPPKVNPFRDDRLIPGLIDATAMNTRTLAQDSAMSVHSAASPTLVVQEAQGESYVVGHGEKAGALFALRRFGFSSERLFADLATAAQEFKASLLADEALGLVPEAENSDVDDMDLDLRTILG